MKEPKKVLAGKMSKNIAEQETKIKDSLFEFVKTHIPAADLNLIDEIVLSYVIAVLEDVGSDPVFDVEGMYALFELLFLKPFYVMKILKVGGGQEVHNILFSQFENINHATVCQWMFELEAKLQEVDQPEDKNVPLDISLPEIVPKIKQRSHENSEIDLPKRIHKLSEMSDGGSTDSSCCDFSDEMDVLQEMFPMVCTIEVKHCLTIAAGDIERATQILIDRQENGQCLNQNNSLTIQVTKKTIDDSELKNRIIERYSYIDKDAFNKEHRPVAPKVEPKKMVRYRDNKIVSLKGRGSRKSKRARMLMISH
ncbi:hypothetical protein NQ318_002229 [Aromia moschata]|uniref:CUE domain-containing protein 2 n=1 Tax=Aromia moschata TaxID=1265417 RepID=A0AAV8Z4K7_9CUCU|nr:hypothetical protein NQ318_002229 [Aromia moschata]